MYLSKTCRPPYRPSLDPNGTRAVNRLSLDISPGMFGLLGPDGAGKSTLMRILATLQEPSVRRDNAVVVEPVDSAPPPATS